WVQDPCERLPQEEVCAHLSDRRYEILRVYHAAMPSEREALDAEQAGIDARLARDCPGACPTHRFPSFPAACLPAALATAASAAPQQVVLYRGTGADGQLTVQNSPCPPGSQQREQVVGGVAATPGAATRPTSTVRTANGEFLTT